MRSDLITKLALWPFDKLSTTYTRFGKVFYIEFIVDKGAKQQFFLDFSNFNVFTPQYPHDLSITKLIWYVKRPSVHTNGERTDHFH
jgi:hypothetical protein